MQFISVQGTDQIQPEAWALEMFRSCNVSVTTEYGFYLVMYVIAGMLHESLPNVYGAFGNFFVKVIATSMFFGECEIV